MNNEIRYGNTLTGKPKYSVWDGRELIGYTDEIGFVQYDITAKRLIEPQKITPVIFGYSETPPDPNVLSQTL